MWFIKNSMFGITDSLLFQSSPTSQWLDQKQERINISAL